MDGRINVAEAPEIMVSCRPPNPFEKANPARMPRPNSPLENTPHNAGAIAGVRVLAVAAPFDNASQRRRPASLDGLHQAMLMQRQRVGLPVGGTVLSKDVGQLQSWLRQSLRPGFAFAGPPGIAAQVVEGATGSEHHLWAHLGVTRGGLDAAVAEQDLNDTDIGSVFQQMGAKAVAQGVDGDPFAKPGGACRFPADVL